MLIGIGIIIMIITMMILLIQDDKMSLRNYFILSTIHIVGLILLGFGFVFGI